MKHQFFIILIFIVLYFVSACSKKQNKQIESNLKDEQITSYREQISSRSKTTKTSDTTKKQLEKLYKKKSINLEFFLLMICYRPQKLLCYRMKISKNILEN